MGWGVDGPAVHSSTYRCSTRKHVGKVKSVMVGKRNLPATSAPWCRNRTLLSFEEQTKSNQVYLVYSVFSNLPLTIICQMSQAFTAIFVRISGDVDWYTIRSSYRLGNTQTRFRMINWSKTPAHFRQSFPGSYNPFQTSLSKFMTTLEVQTRLSKFMTTPKQPVSGESHSDKATDHDHLLFFHPPQAHRQALAAT